MQVNGSKVAVVALTLVALYAVNFIYALGTNQSGGTFGDTFGAVNALFSGSALFFLVLAFISQREELNLVKEERNDTRKLLEGQELIQQSQKAALDQQIFEQSFNSMYSLLLNNLSKLDADRRPNDVSVLEKVGERSVKAIENLQTAPDNLPSGYEIYQVRPAAYMLFYLYKMLTKNRSLDGSLSGYNSLLSSCISEQFGQAICYFALEAALSDSKDRQYIEIAKKLGCIKYLNEKARKNFEQF